MQTVLSLNGVGKDYGAFQAVKSLSFALQSGEIFGFLGPNGAGKTTTLRMVLDIIQPSRGTISILGQASAIPVRRRIGYLPEERGLYRKMRAGETIAYFAKLRGMSGEAATARAKTLMEEYGLGEFFRTRNESLSKGMAQKVQLLSTIAHDPELLILDEPFSGLDPINQAVLEDLIEQLRAAGKTIVFSTHVMAHAERLCDRFLIMAKGEKRFEGTLSEARQQMPEQVILRTGDDIAPLQHSSLIASVIRQKQEGELSEYALHLAAGVSPQTVLEEVIDLGIGVSRFDVGAMSLHDIFVAIAGDPDAESEG